MVRSYSTYGNTGNNRVNNIFVVSHLFFQLFCFFYQVAVALYRISSNRGPWEGMVHSDKELTENNNKSSSNHLFLEDYDEGTTTL